MQMNYHISSTNLINNGNYIVIYSLTITTSVNQSLTNITYGLASNATHRYINNSHSITCATTPLKINNEYVYQGSTFFKYKEYIVSGVIKNYFVSYNLVYEYPNTINVVSKIDYTRIS